ncbi:MAG: TIGR01620 family protein [Hyphomicrobiales bacterium]|jgi:putative membrane protein
MTKTRKPQVLELTSVEVESEAPVFTDLPSASDGQGVSPSRGFKWLALFGSGLAGLAVLGITLWAENFVRTLLERQPALGWVALGLLALAALGLIGFIAKEMRAIMRLEKLDDLRESFQKAYDEEDTPAARKALDQVTAIYRGHPNTAHGRAAFEQQRVGVLDAQDLIVIAEETLMAPLDKQAVRLVSTSARRVSLVTALSPRALVDIAMVAFQCVTLTRQIAQLYGARPGVLGAMKLIRHMMAHLAITGGIAATEGLVSQVLGHSLAARLSTRLGEGVINGLLTARVGIAAIAVTRPMPHIAGNGPTLSEVTKGIAGLGGQAEKKNEDG